MKNPAWQLKSFIYAALFAALTITLGFISIPLPISPSPISLLNLGVMLTASILPARQAFYSILTVNLLGIIGLPVFAGFSSGLGIILGPRGGFYIGFLAAVLVTAFLRGKSENVTRVFVANFLGCIVTVYLIAIPWLSFTTGLDFSQALVVGLYPFLLGDLVKAFFASVLAVSLAKHLVVFRGENV